MACPKPQGLTGIPDLTTNFTDYGQPGLNMVKKKKKRKKIFPFPKRCGKIKPNN
jgi:hypothetical protein